MAERKKFDPRPDLGNASVGIIDYKSIFIIIMIFNMHYNSNAFFYEVKDEKRII